MKFLSKKSILKGKIKIPASKSHTIRGVVIASLAGGKSKLIDPLNSRDAEASVVGCTALGAKITRTEEWLIEGFSGRPKAVGKEIDLMNSGTSTNMLAGISALADGSTTLTGDESLRSRPFEPIVKAINDLGGKAESFQNTGKPPLKISGPILGGFTEIDGLNSQPVSSLLINCPLAKNDTELKMVNFHEKPYVGMTLRWLDEQGIKYKANKDWSKFEIPGDQSYSAFEKTIPADFSSATFPLCAAVICSKSDVLLQGLDMDDSQGDKEVITMLKKMGAQIEISDEGIRAFGSELHGTELDLNNTPDALPALAVVACFAEGETRIVNVAQARIKETDRIKAICTELKKMHADIKETSDGLIINKSKLEGTKVHGYNDHRMVMALTIAGFASKGITTVDTAESIEVTFPNFEEKFKAINASIKRDDL